MKMKSNASAVNGGECGKVDGGSVDGCRGATPSPSSPISSVVERELGEFEEREIAKYGKMRWEATRRCLHEFLASVVYKSGKRGIQKWWRDSKKVGSRHRE